MLTNARLSEAALVEAYALAVESKCAECFAVGLDCAKQPGSLAQGTGTDATVVLSSHGKRSRHVKYAGKHTLFAELLGQARACREATREALRACVEQTHGGYLDYWVRRAYRRAVAMLQGARPCVPPTPSSAVPPPPLSVVAVGLSVVGLCYLSPLPRGARTLAAAVAWDRWLGEPPLAVHPVVLVGNLISALLRRLPERVFVSPALGLASGAAFALMVMAISLVAAHVLLAASEAAVAAATAVAAAHATSATLDAATACARLGAWLLEVLLLKSAIGGQLLGSVALQMARLLERRQLADARIQLSWLCSRDPSSLSADELAGGALESLAENLSDGFVAPLVWYACGGTLAAVGYRVANTLDSRIGYHGRFEWFGKLSARFDDLINLMPARLTAACLAGAGAALPSGDGTEGLRVAWRDCGHCESPNAGWPMAAMAGVLGVRLEKAGHYSLGEPKRPLGPRSIRTGVQVFQMAYALVTALAVAVCAARAL